MNTIGRGLFSVKMQLRCDVRLKRAVEIVAEKQGVSASELTRRLWLSDTDVEKEFKKLMKPKGRKAGDKR